MQEAIQELYVEVDVLLTLEQFKFLVPDSLASYISSGTFIIFWNSFCSLFLYFWNEQETSVSFTVGAN